MNSRASSGGFSSRVVTLSPSALKALSVGANTVMGFWSETVVSVMGFWSETVVSGSEHSDGVLV